MAGGGAASSPTPSCSYPDSEAPQAESAEDPSRRPDPAEMGTPTDRGGDPAGDWRRERWAQRYNKNWASIIEAWAQLLTNTGGTTRSGLRTRRRAPGSMPCSRCHRSPAVAARPSPRLFRQEQVMANSCPRRSCRRSRCWTSRTCRFRPPTPPRWMSIHCGASLNFGPYSKGSFGGYTSHVRIATVGPESAFKRRGELMAVAERASPFRPVRICAGVSGLRAPVPRGARGRARETRTSSGLSTCDQLPGDGDPQASALSCHGGRAPTARHGSQRVRRRAGPFSRQLEPGHARQVL